MNRIMKTPRWLHAIVLLMALGLLPLGCAYIHGPGSEDGQTGDAPERQALTEEYRRAEEEMRKAVAECRLKPEDVERRLIGMRKAMGG